MTGSQTGSGLRTLAVRVTLLAIMAAFAFGLLAILAGDARAVNTFTVDSIADAPDDDVGDGDCDTAGGECTLRAAIQESNGGKLVDLIEGEVDVNRDGTIDTADDLTGVLLHVAGVASLVDIVDGGVDVNGGGVDATDDLDDVALRLADGSFDTGDADILDGKVDVDEDTDITSDTDDTLDDVWLALDVGDTDHDTIKFDPGVFTQGSPGTISVPAFALPDITEDLTIDAIDRGVILDGGGGVYAGLTVKSNNTSGIDFLLLGGGSTFAIQGFTGDGVFVCGDDVSVDDDDSCDAVSLDGVEIDGVVIGTTSKVYDGIVVEAVNLTSVSVTDSEIVTSDAGIFMLANGGTGSPGALGNNTVAVSGNTITGNTDADGTGIPVSLEFNGDLGSTINATVSDNGDITRTDGSSNEPAVELFYCDAGSGCTVASGSTVNFTVDNNASITSDGIGVDIDVDADPSIASPGGTDNADVNVSVSDAKGPITSTDDEAIDVFIDICCGTSDSSSTVTIDGNGDITGDDSGVAVDNFICCGDNNDGDVSVSGNDAITGSTFDGVNVRNEIGDPFGQDSVGSDRNTATTRINNNISITGDDQGVEIDENFAGDDDDSGLKPSNNTSTVEVNDNGKITGVTRDAIVIVGTAGTGGGGRDAGTDNISTITVDGNGPISGDDKGIEIVGTAGKSGGGGDSNDRNSSTVTVTNNGDVTGTTDDAMEIKSRGGKAGGPSFADSGDNNDSTIVVAGNGNIKSSSGMGLSLESAAGKKGDGNSDALGDNNTSTVLVDENGDITGTSYGVRVDSSACCSDDNTTNTNVTNNGKIAGPGSDGVEVDNFAGHDDDNTSLVNVSDNDDISGSYGIDVDSEAGTDDTSNVSGDRNSSTVIVNANGTIKGTAGDGVNIDSQADADDTVEDDTDNSSSVTVTGNGAIEGTGSGKDGIHVGSFVCCDPDNTNTISIIGNLSHITGGSGDGDGIDIEGSFGAPGSFLCCSANTITITDNIGGVISGTDNGIELSVCAEVQGGSNTLDADCIDDSTTVATISNNNISGSGDDGIDLTAGDWTGSVISSNTIKGNGGNGILITSASDLTIGPDNTITENGTNAGDPNAGIVIVEDDLDGSGGVDIRPADDNTITKNSIFDNIDATSGGLGIDLDDDGGANLPAPCDPAAPPYTPNNCLKAPSLNQVVGSKLIGIACGNCTVEVFVADAIPADQATGDVPQHGEGKTYIISGLANILGDFSINLCETDGLITATATNSSGDTSEFSENLDAGLITDPCATATVTPGPTSTPPDTATPANTATPTVTPTVTPTATTTATVTPTAATPVATDTPVATNTPAATNTPVPPTATNTPIDTPVIPATPGITYGDVNKNGVVNAIDVSLILQEVVGFITLSNPANADVNQDGTVDSRDAFLILQFIAGLIPSLPA